MLNGFEATYIEVVKIWGLSLFLGANISFHVLDISKLKTEVGWLRGGGGGGARMIVVTHERKNHIKNIWLIFLCLQIQHANRYPTK